MKQKEIFRKYFKKLGLETEIADIYIALHSGGEQSISELSRTAKVERTRIYRLMEQMKKSGLIEVTTESKRDILRAAPVENIEILISKKEQELRGLQSDFTLVQQLLNANTLSAHGTKVQFYEGVDGLKQMYWNETKSTSETLVIMNENAQMRVKSAFFERWVRAKNENGQPSRGIINDSFIESQKKWYGKRSNERVEKWEARYVPDGVFPIEHWVIVYDNVVGYHDWKNGEIFGIEIHNQAIADTQRRFFEMLWQQATPVDDLTGEKNPTPQ